MKKAAILLAFLLAFLLVACGAPNSAQTTDEEEPTEVSVATVEEEAEADALSTYPLKSSSKYMAYASTLPDIIWTTSGEENGLAGNIYTFTGTVTSTDVIDTGAGEVTYFIVDTADGPVQVADMYHGYEGVMEANEIPEFFTMYIEEPEADYSLPEVGETANFVCMYAGYSGRLEMPSFYFGANEYMVDTTKGIEITPMPEETADVDESEGTDAPHEPTLGEKNALQRAKDYLSFSPFSYSGLIDQLEFDGYTHSEAEYAADNCGASWYAQASIRAEDYLDLMPMSRQELIDQLEHDGFSYAEALYAVGQVGY